MSGLSDTGCVPDAQAGEGAAASAFESSIVVSPWRALGKCPRYLSEAGANEVPPSENSPHANRRGASDVFVSRAGPSMP
jgi:hypothetical protein